MPTCSIFHRHAGVSYRVQQRSDHLTEAYLQSTFSGGERLARRRLFHNQGELFRVKLFAHNFHRARIGADGTLRIDF